jgi:hypothetical protein
MSARDEKAAQAQQRDLYAELPNNPSAICNFSSIISSFAEATARQERLMMRRNYGLVLNREGSIEVGAVARRDYRKRMPEEYPAIPLADVLRAANELVSSGLIKDYALGGALAAIHYVEPFATYDADIFFIPATQDLSGGVPQIYEALQAKGWKVEGDHLLLGSFPVQFLTAHELTEEAVREATSIEYKGVPTKVFRPEHIIAIAAQVGRLKDLARIEQLMEQTDIDQNLLETILKRHKLSLPKQ